MRKTKILLALLVVGSLLIIAATGAVSRNVGTQTMAVKGASNIDEIYYTIKDTGFFYFILLSEPLYNINIILFLMEASSSRGAGRT
jgi:hypothetical protein